MVLVYHPPPDFEIVDMRANKRKRGPKKKRHSDLGAIFTQNMATRERRRRQEQELKDAEDARCVRWGCFFTRQAANYDISKSPNVCACSTR